MSAWSLIPRAGGKATTPAVTTAGLITDADGSTYYLDLSLCTGVIVQQVAGSGVGGTFQLLETINGSDFFALGSAIAVQDGNIDKFDLGDHPFGRIEVDCTNVTGLSASATLTLDFMGHAIGF